MNPFQGFLGMLLNQGGGGGGGASGTPTSPGAPTPSSGMGSVPSLGQLLSPSGGSSPTSNPLANFSMLAQLMNR